MTLDALATSLGLRLFLFAALVFVPLERMFALRPEQPVLRRDLGSDLVYTFLNRLVVQAAVAVIIAGAAWLAANTVPAGVRTAVADAPLWAQLPGAILVADLGFYALHRLFHEVPALWRFHSVHHGIETMDWIAAARVHPFDQVITRGLSVAPLYVLGFSDAALTAFTLLYFWHSHLLHANVTFTFGPLGKVVASPRWHHWHHADEPEAYDHNYAGQLAFLDRLFGTHYQPDRPPRAFGVSDPVPRGYLRHLVYPFVRRRAQDGR